MLRRFYGRLGMQCYGIRYDHESTAETVLGCITRGICLVGEHSCAGAMLYPFPYNKKVCVGQIVFWYYEANREMGIFDAIVEACWKSGAQAASVASLSARLIGRRFYESRGFHLAEGGFMKVAGTVAG